MAEHLVSNSDLLLQLGKLEGQVGQILQLMQANHTATNQRLDDKRAAFNARMDGHDTRLERIESRERSTAIKAAASGALSGMVTSMIAAQAIAREERAYAESLRRKPDSDSKKIELF